MVTDVSGRAKPKTEQWFKYKPLALLSYKIQSKKYRGKLINTA
jgi:hypothetical protein